MSDVLKEVLSGLDETDALLKKITLMERKKSSWGLSEDDEFTLKDMKVTYYIRCEEILSDIFAAVIDKLMTISAEDSLKKIQELIPWNGRLLIHSEKIDAVNDAIENLSKKQLKALEKELQNIHRQVFYYLNIACQDEVFLDSFEKLGSMVSGGQENSGILDSLSYIDTIYQDFADLIGAKLDKVVLDEGE